MKNLAAVLTIANVTSLASVSHAQDREEGARALVNATQLAEHFMHAKEACEHKEQAVDVESIAQAYPDMFLNIGPDDPRWAQARAIYVQYGVSTCVPQNIDGYVTEAVMMYEDALSEKELAEVNRFYASTVGRKFAAVSSSVTAKLNHRMYEENEQLRESGARRLEAEMLKVGLKGLKGTEAINPRP